MRITRTITASVAAILGAAALAGPAAAGQQGANDSAKANVYVPPAAAYTAAPAINRHVPAASASSSGFDWRSAGIGAAAAIAAFLAALGGAAGLRRRQQTQPTTA